MISVAYSLSVAILPLTMSALYRAFNFATAMDVLGLVLLANTIVYLLHVSCSRRINNSSLQEKDEDAAPLVKKDDSTILQSESD